MLIVVPGNSQQGVSEKWVQFGVSDPEHARECVGALNWPMDKILISSYVKGGQMPRGHNLKSAERRELYAKLIQEYFATD